MYSALLLCKYQNLEIEINGIWRLTKYTIALGPFRAQKDLQRRHEELFFFSQFGYL